MPPLGGGMEISMKKLLVAILCLVMLLSSTACSIRIFEKGEITDLSGKSESSATEGAITEQKEEPEIKEVEKTKLIGVLKLPLSNSFIDVVRFTKAFKKYNYKYMLCTYYLDQDPYTFQAVPKERMEELYNKDGRVTISDLENNAALIINHLTRYSKEDDSIGYDSYIYAAFGVDLTKNKTIQPIDYFKEQKFSLTCENAAVLKMIGHDRWAREWNGEIAVLVSADVTCNENDGEFKNLEWVPAVGETKKITFIIFYFNSPQPDNTISPQVSDIAIYDENK